MIDELIEFKEYSEDLYKDNPRLIASLFFKPEKGKKCIKCNGITRALTIIARYYLFDNGKDYYKLKKVQRKKLREEVLIKLNEWCFSEEGALYKYFEKNGKINLWDDFKESKEKLWNSANIYMSLNAPTFYEFAISFPIIIADAIQAGPLKVRYLKIRKGFEENIYFQTKSMRKKSPDAVESLTKNVDKKGQLAGKCADYRNQLLKQICAYLVNAEGPSEFVTINSIDLANWMNIKSFASNSDSEQVYFFYKNQPLYEYKNKKYYINQKMIKELEISLVDEKEQGSEYVIYKDNGAGVNSLKEI